MAKATDHARFKKMGSEPGDLEARGVLEGTALAQIMTWYHSVKDRKHAKNYLLEWVETNRPEQLAAARHTTEKEVNRTQAWIARLHTRGGQFPQEATDRLNEYVDSLEVTEETRDGLDSVRTKRDRFYSIVGDFETALDNLDPEFQPYEYLSKNSIPHTYANRLVGKYMPIVVEYLDAIDGKDPDLVEAYGRFSKAALLTNAMYSMLICSDSLRYVGNVAKVRKPRKVKQKSAETLLKHFKFLDKDDGLKLVSVNPQNIFGANELYVLNTSNNVMTVFVAKEGGLGIHRSAITNYDDVKTKSKRVGKRIKEVLATVFEGNKKARSTVLELVSSEYISSTDRINTSTILLRAVK